MTACDAVREMLAAHALGALGDTERVLVHDHLEACAGCQDASAVTQRDVDLIEAPPIAPPPAVWSKIRARIERSEQGADPVRDAEPSPVISLSCSFCRGGLLRTGAVYCASCLAPHHPECFAEYGRCSVMGCGEAQVVRPAGAPPLADFKRPPAVARPRRRWFVAGGLGALVTAAALVTVTGAPGWLGGPPQQGSRWTRRPPYDLEGARFRIDVRDASLGEAVAEVASSVNVEIEVPPECSGVLLRSGRWEGSSWSEALRELAEGLDLRLEQGSSKRWRLSPTRSFAAERFPAATPGIASYTTTRAHLDGGVSGPPLFAGGPHRIEVGTLGGAVAVVHPGGLRVFVGDRQIGEVEARVHDLAWSPNGTRLAYMAERPGGGQLGLFDESGGANPLHVLLEGLEDVSAQVAWVEALGERHDDLILLRTLRDLKRVSVVGGQPITLQAPNPEGYQRFQVRPLAPGRFLVEYPQSVEAWSISPLERVWKQPLRCPTGYRIELAGGYSAQGALVTDTAAWLFRVSDGKLPSLPAVVRERQDGAWQVGLSATADHVAWLDGDELLVRPVNDPSSHYEHLAPNAGGGVRGFAWAPFGQALAFWTQDACYVADVDALSFSAGLNLSSPRRQAFALAGEIEAVRWIGVDQLLVTTSATAPRQAVVRARPLDD